MGKLAKFLVLGLLAICVCAAPSAVAHPQPTRPVQPCAARASVASFASTSSVSAVAPTASVAAVALGTQANRVSTSIALATWSLGLGSSPEPVLSKPVAYAKKKQRGRRRPSPKKKKKKKKKKPKKKPKKKAKKKPKGNPKPTLRLPPKAAPPFLDPQPVGEPGSPAPYVGRPATFFEPVHADNPELGSAAGTGEHWLEAFTVRAQPDALVAKRPNSIAAKRALEVFWSDQRLGDWSLFGTELQASAAADLKAQAGANSDGSSGPQISGELPGRSLAAPRNLRPTHASAATSWTGSTLTAWVERLEEGLVRIAACRRDANGAWTRPSHLKVKGKRVAALATTFVAEGGMVAWIEGDSVLLTRADQGEGLETEAVRRLSSARAKKLRGPLFLEGSLSGELVSGWNAEKGHELWLRSPSGVVFRRKSAGRLEGLSLDTEWSKDQQALPRLAGYWLLVRKGDTWLLRHLGLDLEPDREDVEVGDQSIRAGALSSWRFGAAVALEKGAGKQNLVELMLYRRRDSALRSRNALQLSPEGSGVLQGWQLSGGADRLGFAWTELKGERIDVWTRELGVGRGGLGPARLVTTDLGTANQTAGALAHSPLDWTAAVWLDGRSRGVDRPVLRALDRSGPLGKEFLLPLPFLAPEESDRSGKSGGSGADVPAGEALSKEARAALGRLGGLPALAPDVALAGDGVALVTWVQATPSGAQVWGQALELQLSNQRSASAVALGPASRLDSDQHPLHAEVAPVPVALSPGSGFVLAYHSMPKPTPKASRGASEAGQASVVCVRVGVSGVSSALPHVVETSGECKQLDLTRLDGGRLVLVWDHWEPERARLRAQLLSRGMEREGMPFWVDPGPTALDSFPSVAPGPDGGFLMAWVGGGKPAAVYQVASNPGDAEGTDLGKQAKARGAKGEQERQLKIKRVDPAISFEQAMASADILLRLFDRNGSAKSVGHAASTHRGAQAAPSLTRLQDRSWLLAWQDNLAGHEELRAMRVEFSSDLKLGSVRSLSRRSEDAPLDGVGRGELRLRAATDPQVAALGSGFVALWSETRRQRGLDVFSASWGVDFDRDPVESEVR